MSAVAGICITDLSGFGMVFSTKDKMLIKNLVLLKGFSSRRLLHEFPQKCRNKNSLDVLPHRRSEAAVNLCLL